MLLSNRPYEISGGSKQSLINSRDMLYQRNFDRYGNKYGPSYEAQMKNMVRLTLLYRRGLEQIVLWTY